MAISSAAMMEESAGGNLLKSRLEASRKVLLEKLGSLKPEIGIILGSGLGPLADHIQDALYIPFEEVPYMKLLRPQVMWADLFVELYLGKTLLLCRVASWL
mgnify:CR=1 FL=1